MPYRSFSLFRQRLRYPIFCCRLRIKATQSSTSPILTATARFTRHSLYYTLQYVLLTTNLTYWSAFATCGTKMRRDYDSHRSSTSPILTATARFTRHSLYYTLQYVLLTTNLTLLGSLCNV
uniref:Uncharacterized protein n=1 Tax=Glossina austeni TaxID=7395 RepID=A0A1A9VMN4_GLOAU